MSESSAYLKIGNAVISDLVSYKVGYYKLWGEDAGRSMTGAMAGTLIGIFPKIEVTTRRNLTDAEAQTIISATAADYGSVTYWDAISASLKTATFYFGDVTDEIVRRGVHAPISFAIIAQKRRT